ncbi:methylenetetrahydrofolate reductase [Nostoc linckia z18]|uniref:Methylenetetrahydrofolate reductase n=3 Tax=Nostoc linckia TaxID=92942 RepID=A0A9Q6EM43_NOSLI|nr:methylenetetrahydrofolate reductase [Nostoc linckia z1]PHJ71588.1 methylenetetrahydrofolate reductase [Nostoc linckia z3]PHJ77663.1 methylenetetrahydrofolate reductase [Nostoc linckia z2]PHJ86793.1 methylenetetrahydrofolate reductase [Nostoc linckia z4]PHJ90489.1 methylenetetrahydrofolate reductase [Nostoc linckia z6]PHJ91321.1 methylenetetrahydrofolate reductase [Nostoc linckia z7]PHK04717.1 methylenetetrahydrofolate reductase [Nostoc linckia z8]PHK06264.1 methylenetetrahydrofolate reduc
MSNDMHHTHSPTAFRRAVQAGEFLVTAEVAPPKGGDPTHMIKMAATLKGRVHAVNITDGSRAVLRMSSLVASLILLQNGVEPICQIACRDRNRIGLQADLMGAHALGIHNILALTGDPVKAGDHSEAKAVFDLEAVRLLQIIRKMNQGVDCNDKPLTDGALDLFPGAAVDPQCKSWSGLQSRFERKIEAGAQFFQSQLITDFERLEKFMDTIATGYKKPILAGIFLLKSAKNAHFINKCVPGVNIPQHIIDRLAKAKDPLEEGMKIAAEQVQIARQLCQGVHMMAVKREDLISPILDLAGVATVNQLVAR